MSKGVTTPTVRVYQVHRGRDDRLKNKKSEDFPENRLVVQVAKPHWLQSGEHLTNLEICGLCLRTFVTDDETVQVERQQIIHCTKVWQSLRNFNCLFPHLENKKKSGEGDGHNGPETEKNAVIETIIVVILCIIRMV